MVSEELSQDEIDNLFSSGSDKEEASNDINPLIKEFANLLNTSLEDVLKTAFSLEIVSKFIDLNIKSKDELSFEDGIFMSVNLTTEGKSAPCFIYTNKEFASILSDLMLMGPGEAKEKLEPDDLDAIKELFSQVFGNLQTAFKERQQQELSVEIKDINEAAEIPEGDSFYALEFDLAIPNIKSDKIILFAEQSSMDNMFEKHEEEIEPAEEINLPFESAEEEAQDTATPTNVPSQATSGNLDLIMDVDLDVKIRIGQKNMLIKDILKLKEGSIIELEKNIEEPMEILINNKVVAKGVVVVVGGRFGIKITNIDTKEERIKSLGG